MLVGYAPPPTFQPDDSGTGLSGGLLQQLASRMQQGTPSGIGLPQMPSYQGAFTRQAYDMAGPPAMNAPVVPPRTNPPPLSDLPAGLAPMGSVVSTATGAPAAPNNRFSGAATGALAGYQYSHSPWGALIGGIVGYGANGGVKDANPLKASGFTGINMDQAWQDQNLARLASNPAASVASKLGVSSDSVLGKVLDPASLMSGHKGSHWRNWNAFNQAFPGTTVNSDGNYVLSDGQVVNQKQLDDLAGTWYGATQAPDGDQAGWQKKFQNVVSSIYGDQPNILFGG